MRSLTASGPLSASHQRVVVRGRYVRPAPGIGRTLSAGLRYMQLRPLGPGERPEDRHFFGPARDDLTRAEARTEILAHPGRRAAYHRLILSPGQNLADLPDWTRAVLSDLAAHQQLELHWVAVAHRNTDHHHVHVLLAGAGAPYGRPGLEAPVILRREQYDLLRLAGARQREALVDHDLLLRATAAAHLLDLGFATAAVTLSQDGHMARLEREDHDQRRRGARARDATRAHV